MRKIIIDGESLCSTHTGCQRFMVEILKELDRLLANEKDFEIEVVYPGHKKISGIEFENIKIKPLFCLPKTFRRIVLPIYICISDGMFCGLANDWPAGNRNIICLHDIIPIKENAKYPPEEAKKCYRKFKKIKKKADIILTVSQTAKDDICKTLNIERERVIVIYNGWEHINKIEEDESVFARHSELKRGEYVYALGSVAPHKNLIWVKEVAKRNPNIQFAVAGNMHKYGEKSDIEQSNILYLGFVTDTENKALMKNCKLFVQPSKEEGFGIPPLEALACGAKIAVSKASCLPEIYEDCAVYFDPDDYDICIDDLVRGTMSSPEKLMKKYSWKKSAAVLFKTIKQELNR